MPEGWYDDPFTDEFQRYWTGTSWTKQTRPRPERMGTAGGAPAPAPGSGQPVALRDYLVWSILTLIFCFWPLAIPAVVFAVRANSAKRAGAWDDAVKYTERARLFLMLSVVAGVVIGGYLAITVILEGPGALGL